MFGEGEPDPSERIDVTTLGPTDQHRRWRDHIACRRGSADAVRVLDAEPGTEPCIQERGVVRGHDHRVPDRPGLHPPTGQVTVQVAHHLRFRCGVAGALDPHVRTPALAARRRDEIADDVLAADRDRTIGSIASDEILDLATSHRGILEPGSSSGSTARWSRWRSASSRAAASSASVSNGRISTRSRRAVIPMSRHSRTPRLPRECACERTAPAGELPTAHAGRGSGDHRPSKRRGGHIDDLRHSL